MNMSRHLSDSTNGNVVQCDLSIAAEHAQQTGGTAPSFLRNTHDMITFCDRSKRSVASWGNNGTYVIIHDKDALTREVFPAYFKHSNFKSFARQLNFYGFRKIKSKDKECCIYHHDYFQINRADLLPHIQRQTNENHHDTQAMSGTQKLPTFVNTEEVNELKQKVNTLTVTVSNLHKEIADLKSLLASFTDVVRAHDEFIRQSQTSQILHPNTAATVTDNTQTRANFNDPDKGDESLKPQAKQTSSPIHGSINMIDSHQNGQPPYAYVSISERQEFESHRAKRQKFPSEESVAYAPIVSQHQFALPPSSNMQSTTTQPIYENRQDHWTNHASENYVEHNHNLNNEQQAHNISHNTVDNQSSSTSATFQNVTECSADQDYGFEDLAWFALFEEDIAHQPDDPTAAPQA